MLLLFTSNFCLIGPTHLSIVSINIPFPQVLKTLPKIPKTKEGGISVLERKCRPLIKSSLQLIPRGILSLSVNRPPNKDTLTLFSACLSRSFRFKGFIATIPSPRVFDPAFCTYNHLFKYHPLSPIGLRCFYNTNPLICQGVIESLLRFWKAPITEDSSLQFCHFSG